MNTVGIDPGLEGALVFLGGSNNPVIVDIPISFVTKTKRVYEPTQIRAYLEWWANEDATFFIESVHAMPKQGVTSTFNFGRGFGLLEGIIVGLKAPYQLVTPQQWKKDMMAGMPREKDASRLVALRLFPNLTDKLKLKKHHGRADALLLAEYGRRLLGKN
jgi:crossover junction endodeoxyribonuclease RuvC